MSDAPNLMQQADFVLRAHHSAVTSNSRAAEDGGQEILSILTLETYKQALSKAGDWAIRHHGIAALHQLTPDIARAYLRARIECGLSQKQIDNDRLAMQFVVGKLERLKTDRQPDRRCKAYTAVQIERISARQSPQNGLATRIARNAGLRAQELLTLRRGNEAQPSDGRSSHRHLFHGRDGAHYVVTGYRGHRRHVMIDHPLASALEATRLSAPTSILDRRTPLCTVYAIGGGKAWSVSFGKASRHDLGWSAGAEGLRHSYAQNRLQILLGGGHKPHDAKLILSQELGQSSAAEIDIFLR